MKITTVIPSHGLRSTLITAVESAISGNGADEVFVLDTVGDAVGGIRSSEVKIVRAPDRGMPGNWNQCFGIGTGEWLHILHDDDRVLPGFYDHVRQAPSTAVAAATGYRNVDADSGRVTFAQAYMFLLGSTVAGLGEPLRIGGSHLMKALTHGNCFRPSSVVMRREVAAKYPFPDVGANDWCMWLRLATLGDWWISPQQLVVNSDGPENDGNRIGAIGRAEAILGTIEHVETWLPAPWNMLAARDGYSKTAAAEGAHEVADLLALRKKFS